VGALPGCRIFRLKGAIIAAADMRAAIGLLPAAAFRVMFREVIFDGVVCGENDL
jgi:hypothetical protein